MVQVFIINEIQDHITNLQVPAGTCSVSSVKSRISVSATFQKRPKSEKINLSSFNSKCSKNKTEH